MEPVTFFLPYSKPSGDLEVDVAWVYKPGGSPITKKDIVYTPVGGSTTIIVKGYAQYGCSPEHNRNTIW